jgi:thioester reductase-like protein
VGALLFTGFPGAIGSALLPLLLADRPGDHAVCLVQRRWAGLAKRRADQLTVERPELDGRIRLVEGDISVAGLDLADLAELQRDVVEVWHLAAVYDLGVDRATGMRVNVDGTRHVLEVAAGCGNLRRLHHMSTCYVSGRWAGVATEADLVRGQSFNNHYEETKFLAEVEVQASMGQGMPVTVYRPAIVTGDSRTGEAHKYDGAYLLIRLLERQGRVAVVPVVGDPAMTRMNIVPSDFVTAAVARLSTLERSAGRVYQLADPNPLTVDELLDELGRATGRRLVRVLVGRRTAKAAIRRLPGVARLVGAPAAAIDYLVHPTHYATDNMRADLAGSGIQVPPLPSYLPRLVAYVRAHPEVGDAAMI